jgi:hypothetical protein
MRRIRLPAAGFILALAFFGALADVPKPAGVLTPVSGADGTFEEAKWKGETVRRCVEVAKDKYASYLYFRVEGEGQKAAGPVFVEVTYVDSGAGRLSLQYNAPQADYKEAEVGSARTFSNRGGLRTAVFRLKTPAFRRAQSLHTDLRLCSPGPSTRLAVVKATLYLEPTLLFQKYHAKPWLEPYKGPRRNDVNATTLRKKVLCGYQGWFRCPGDDAEGGWVHWSRDAARIAPETLTFDMWPDLAEFTDEGSIPPPASRTPTAHKRTCSAPPTRGPSSVTSTG